ncbi:hypothetical protein BKA65DRAFT_554339 [Rhexocercosporidium sp. MPI-PUGE-AT-0058]|nr:hypothetical protein BKA65DRAFT_554339 [Rhexocercosporidium sp. MPI-PUGE-AT-0058]
MSSQLQTFHNFLSLPPEIRSQVWELSLPPSLNTSNIIHIHFTQQAYHPLPSKRNPRPPKLDYIFKCFSPPGPHGPPTPDTRSREAYASYLRENPHELRLNHGQRIRFNASRDTIFMDRASLYALGQYLLYRDPKIIYRNLKGFRDILTLGTPLRHFNCEGFVSGKAYGLTRCALSGVVRFVMLRDIPGVPDEGVARSDLIYDLDGQLRDLLAMRKWSREIVDGIWEVRERIPGDVDDFFGASDLGERLRELEGVDEGDEGEEALEEARVLGREETEVDEREQCMEPECGFCRMQTWEERRYSMAEQR